MWRTALQLCLGLVLSQLVPGGGAVKVLCRPGQRVSLPCSYRYEDGSQVSQLSVQWRSPRNELLCHYIKHKSFQNCSVGYDMSYSPGSITLTIQEVRAEDYGAHVCSVSKRHEFSDHRVELDRMTDSVTSAPVGGGTQSGLSWRLVALHALACFMVSMFYG